MRFPWLAALLLLDLTVKTVRVRRRLRALPVLAPDADADAGDWHLVAAEGVAVNAAVRRAAAEHARRNRLQAVDLIPGDLHTEAMIGLFKILEPRAYRALHRSRRKAVGLGAGHAVLLDGELAMRAGVREESGLDPVEFITVVQRVQRHAPGGAGLVVAPAIRAVRQDPARRKACLRAYGAPVPLMLFFQIGELGGLASAIRMTPLWGLLALALYWIQPCLIVAGRCPVRPADLRLTSSLRPLLALWTWLRAAFGRWRSSPEGDSHFVPHLLEGRHVRRS